MNEREREIGARFWEGDILAINRSEYPAYSKFRRGTLEWIEGESVGIRLDANDTLEQFLIDDCTLIARGEKYHCEQRIAALEAALTPFAAVGAVVAALRDVRPQSSYAPEHAALTIGGATVTFAHLIAAAAVVGVTAEAVTGGGSGKGGISEHGEKAK